MTIDAIAPKQNLTLPKSTTSFWEHYYQFCTQYRGLDFIAEDGNVLACMRGSHDPLSEAMVVRTDFTRFDLAAAKQLRENLDRAIKDAEGSEK